MTKSGYLQLFNVDIFEVIGTKYEVCEGFRREEFFRQLYEKEKGPSE